MYRGGVIGLEKEGARAGGDGSAMQVKEPHSGSERP
jgi:hypothetical protein